ncbi:transmembrane amino acid transporter protein-domain-containing protein [Chytridium lagenaria]|nr:transmembrane amino acid transporter protein-domain-containing protein [Chytridium lagenaria]
MHKHTGTPATIPSSTPSSTPVIPVPISQLHQNHILNPLRSRRSNKDLASPSEFTSSSTTPTSADFEMSNFASYGTSSTSTGNAATPVNPAKRRSLENVLQASQSSVLQGETHDTAPLLQGRQGSDSAQGDQPDGIPIEDVSAHHGNSVAEAVYHIICVIAGSGVLQLPFALNQSGWVGVLVILFSAWANQYSGMLLVKCLYINGSERLKGFPHIGQKAFGNIGKIVVEVLNSVMLLGVPIVYLILSGMNFEILFGYFDTRGWIIVSSLLIMIPFLIFKTLKEIAILSAFGVFATIVVIATVLVYAIIDIPKNSGVVTHKFIDLSLFPSALGSISFSYAGNFVYPEVESSMADPSKFPLVLTLSMTIISAMYLFTAVLGYAAYGDRTVSPILNNLPQGPVAKFAIAVITAHVLFAIPVLITTFSLEMERRLGITGKAGRSVAAEGTLRAILRVAIVFAICGFAMAVPFFADFMTLLGAIANTNLIFVFPVLFDFSLYGFRNRPLKDKIIGILILLVGVYGGVIGGYEAIMALVRDFQGKGSGKIGH